jgi:hypothetical protein
VSDPPPRDTKRLRSMSVALFVPAGLLAAAAVYVMYRLGTRDENHDDLARLGLLLTSASLVLVLAAAMLRSRARRDPEDPQDDNS